MIDFTTPNGTISVKSSYYDLTVGQYNQILDKKSDLSFVFSVLTGLAKEEVLQYDLSEVAPFVSFLGEDPRTMEPLNYIEFDGREISEVNIWKESWSKKIMADKLLRVIKSEQEEKTDQYIVCDLLELAAIYVQKKFKDERTKKVKTKLSELPVAVVYPFALELERQLIETAEIERKMLKSTYTPEQIQAGIAEFNKLGVFNTIDMIAGGDPLKYEQVEQLPFETIFNKLLHSNISVNFEKKLSKIYRDKSKSATK